MSGKYYVPILLLGLALLGPMEGAAAWTVQLLGSPPPPALNYVERQRLSQVLLDAQAMTHLPAMTGFVATVADQTAFQQRRDALIARWDEAGMSDAAAAIHQLQQVLRARQWGARRNWTVDVDALQVHPELDPWLDADLLWRPTPPAQGVLVAGAVNQAGVQPFIPGGDIKDYLPAQRHPRAERDVVALVQADGVVQWAPIAYWNRVPHAVAPGAIIYIPFVGDWWRSQRVDQLNQATIALFAESIAE